MGYGLDSGKFWDDARSWLMLAGGIFIILAGLWFTFGGFHNFVKAMATPNEVLVTAAEGQAAADFIDECRHSCPTDSAGMKRVEVHWENGIGDCECESTHKDLSVAIERLRVELEQTRLGSMNPKIDLSVAQPRITMQNSCPAPEDLELEDWELEFGYGSFGPMPTLSELREEND